ncbi:hypothetical protein NPIL_589321 [Nephila pilipes]|uniref:Uncharacterized protein n=1 Tax=Nephila pilipes TaxID=299642 RepID=A0A8X6PFY5_NEPPI|nr:hypothetical protein NPIL_589321 [Nephila pilipes]
MSKPVSQKAYDIINSKMVNVSEALTNASMTKTETEKKIIDSTANSIAISCDGTWKTRDHICLVVVCALIGVIIQGAKVRSEKFCVFGKTPETKNTTWKKKKHYEPSG